MTLSLDVGIWTATQWALLVLLVLVVAYALWRKAAREYRYASARTVSYAVVLAAVAIVLGQLSIPVGFARIAPSQHMVNVMAAVLIGPWWATLVAFVAAVVRNMTGLGTPLAFPGGMIGALLAGLAWRATRRIWAPALAEVFGTGIIAALVSGALVAPAVMGKATTAFTYIVPFLASTMAGTLIGVAALWALRRADVVVFDRQPLGPLTKRPPDV